MGLFFLGVITGLIISILVFLILAYFRTAIEHKVIIIEKYMGSHGPKVKGAIIMPKSDIDVAREEIIAKNKALGRDTPIDELR